MAEAASNKGRFVIGYEDDVDCFVAYEDVDGEGALAPIERFPSLVDLLESCREVGLTEFGGVSHEAAVQIHQWLTIDRPAAQYIEGLLAGEIHLTGRPSEQGPKGRIGFLKG